MAGIIPFVLFSGAAYTVPSCVLAFLFGPELPALLRGLIGLLTVITAARGKFLLSKGIFSFPSTEEMTAEQIRFPDKLPGRFASWLPYILIVFFLVTRLPGLRKCVPGIPAAGGRSGPGPGILPGCRM
ncbi:MAG: L-lactate permease [Spirochaetales bacterium]|nr:L-lactate permease [Spirochaetales bacterium]